MSEYEFGKSISTGESFKFDKSDGLNRIRVDLIWRGEADLDVCAFLVGDDGLLNHREDFVFYNSEYRWHPSSEENVTEGKIEPFDIHIHRTKKNWKKITVPVSSDLSVIGSPDIKGNEDESDEVHCETLHVVLDRVSLNTRAIIFCGAIYNAPNARIITFGEVKDPAIIITDEDTDEILCRYDIKDNFAEETALEAGQIIISDEGEWTFEPLGKGYTGGIKTLATIYE